MEFWWRFGVTFSCSHGSGSIASAHGTSDSSTGIGGSAALLIECTAIEPKLSSTVSELLSVKWIVFESTTKELVSSACTELLAVMLSSNEVSSKVQLHNPITSLHSSRHRNTE